MKRRVLVLFALVVLVLTISAQAIEPRTVSAKPRLTFSGTTAYCSVNCVGERDTDEIKATLTLYQGTTYVDSWSGSGTGRVSFSGSCKVESGKTYIRESPARSQGVVYFRDPSGGYSSHQTKAAWENMSRSVATMEIAAIRVAASGKTYGSLLMAKTPEESPDLIAAIGTEGQSGYVAREDFLNPKDDRCKNPAYSGRHIPLYDLSGNVIGTFEITFSHPDTAGKNLETIKSELATGSQEDQRLWAIADKTLVNGSYPVNARGQSYGPNFLRELVGYSPDLTPAVNDDGVAGYLRCIKELPVSAEESAIRSAATSKPLYDVDGNVIGVCELATPTPVETIGKSLNEIRTEIGNWSQSR